MFETRDIYASSGEYFICRIEEQDRDNFIKLQVQTVGEDTLFLNPACQDIMWQSVLEEIGKTYTYSIFDTDNEYCGKLELQDRDIEHPELGISLLEEKRNKGITAKVIKLFAETFCKERCIEYFLIRISSKNSHSIHVFEKMGAILIEKEGNFFADAMNDIKRIFETEDTEKWENVMGRIYDKEDDEIILRYKLLPELFSGSN